MPAGRKRYRSENADVLETMRLLRERAGRQHVVLTGRGAAGIWAALRAMGFRDRAVLIPANTCYIVLWAVLKSGNRPVLMDADVSSPELEVISRKTQDEIQQEKPAAIIPCHLYGLPAPMEAICQWARENGVMVIEDAALALGATVDDKPAGSWGEASVFSFGLGKIADQQLGGAFLTDDSSLAKEVERLLKDAPEFDDRLMALTNQWNGLYWPLHQYENQNPNLLDLYPRLFEIYGDLTDYRLPSSHWRGMPEKLAGLDDNLAHRARVAAMYDEQLLKMVGRGATCCAPTGEPLLKTLPRPVGSILWRYPLLVAPEIRDELLVHLWEQGVHDATRWYPSLRYMTAALAPEIVQTPTPKADALADSIINLRVDGGVKEIDVQRVAQSLDNFFNAKQP